MFDKRLLIPLAYSAVSAGLVFESGERLEKELIREAKIKGPEIV